MSEAHRFIKDWNIDQSPILNSKCGVEGLWLGFFFKPAEINWGTGGGRYFINPRRPLVVLQINNKTI